MPYLQSLTRKSILLPKLEVAKNFSSRLVGLLGKSSLTNEEGLWIERCNSIHTFFMRFAIDCVFVDQENKVCSIKRNVAPFRMITRQPTARAVIEMKSGNVDFLGIQLGENLDVGT